LTSHGASPPPSLTILASSKTCAAVTARWPVRFKLAIDTAALHATGSAAQCLCGRAQQPDSDSEALHSTTTICNETSSFVPWLRAESARDSDQRTWHSG
jgi:hypothetical protein